MKRQTINETGICRFANRLDNAVYCYARGTTGLLVGCFKLFQETGVVF